MTSCLRDRSPHAWNPSIAARPDLHLSVALDGGPDFCPSSVVAWPIAQVGDIYCADIGVRVPWCTAYHAQWRGAHGLTGPTLDVQWVPEPAGLVAGLVVLAWMGRRRARQWTS